MPDMRDWAAASAAEPWTIEHEEMGRPERPRESGPARIKRKTP